MSHHITNHNVSICSRPISTPQSTASIETTPFKHSETLVFQTVHGLKIDASGTRKVKRGSQDGTAE